MSTQNHEMASGEDSAVKIHCLNKIGFIWNVKDVRLLREEFRIVGTLTGSLPRAPRQNNQLGLPLQLLPEEITLLVEKGIAEVVEDVFGEPSDKDISQLEESRKQSYEEQVEMFREERREEIKRNLPKIMEGKKAKKRKALEQEGKGGEIDEAELEKEITKDLENIDIPAIKEDLALVELPLEAQSRERTTCQVLKWSYPKTLKEQVRYKVFRDFWEKGFYLTSGSKFGGDFLVYPGDPARYHSFYVAICVDHDQQMTALDVIAIGRLATNVKKTAVMCSVDSDGHVLHTSLQWTGFS